MCHSRSHCSVWVKVTVIRKNCRVRAKNFCVLLLLLLRIISYYYFLKKHKLKRGVEGTFLGGINCSGAPRYNKNPTSQGSHRAQGSSPAARGADTRQHSPSEPPQPRAELCSLDTSLRAHKPAATYISCLLCLRSTVYNLALHGSLEKTIIDCFAYT